VSNKRGLKRQARKEADGIRLLLVQWDPLGAVAAGAPRDEYDCMIGPIHGLLRRGTSVDEMNTLLIRELVHHFGIRPEVVDPDGFAARLLGWWREFAP
jgi:hypothetical protein